MARVKLSPPWDIYATEVETLFKHDKEVHVLYDHEQRKISLYVDNAEKADALSKLLPDEKAFGNNAVHIEIIPANEASKNMNVSKGTLYKTAFEGNEAFSRVKVVRNAFLTNDITYVVFVKKVVQFYTDNLGDLYGFRSTLYQEVAKDVFGDESGVYFCTEATNPNDANGLMAPLGEWP